VAQVVYSEAALVELERIAEFLLAQDPPTALERFAGIRSAVEVLTRHPLIGRRVEGQLRELVISRGRAGYIALYRFDAPLDLVRVLRVRHQSEAGYRD
jgi:plasmid stabilization system protein ParE